jgi:hypothetical protein
MNINGKFVGYGVGDVSPECEHVNHRLLLAYNSHSHASAYGVTDTTTFDTATAAALTDLCSFMNADPASKIAAGARGAKFPLRTDGIADLNVRKAIGAYTPPPPPGPSSMFFSVNGAGSTWDMGYPYDIGEALEPGVPLANRSYYHQPIGYNTAPVPMQKGVADGQGELVRQLYLPRPQFGGRNCTQIPYQLQLYSMGSLVGFGILQRIWYGDLQDLLPMYMGSSSFGPPSRQADHVYPGGIPVDGEGIAKTDTFSVPDVHWDFVSSKGMVNSKGDDLYAKVGGADQFLETKELTLKDIRSVWHLVNTGNPLTLFEAVASLALSPSFSKFEGAAGAAINAARFFIIQGLSPHTTYQFVQTRANDNRSAWDQALWHAVDLKNRLALPFANGARPGLDPL